MHPPDQTIVALSTPHGRGAVGLVRLSGPEAMKLARSVFIVRSKDRIHPFRSVLGKITVPDNGDRRTIDSGYLTFYPAGRSYTGQDVVELSCHASPVVVEQLLEALVGVGARPADRGEFTYRALLSGRMDLAQAEGVRDLIAAATPEAARVAHEQIGGGLSRRVGELREALVDLIGRAEAGLEFAEEPDTRSASSDLAERTATLLEGLDRFIATYRQGRLLREGARVVVAGRPNSGKSSLFNRLLRSRRAIVSAESGTTRDYITERIDLGGIPVTLVDTAGLRADAVGVERQGVQRTREILEGADIVLLLCACDEQPDGQDLALLDSCGRKAILVASKSDLASGGLPPWAGRHDAIGASAKSGEGVEALREKVFRLLAHAPSLSHERAIVTDARHHEALLGCRTRIAAAHRSAREGASEEVILVDAYGALRHLEEITGRVTIEAIYDRIFSTFCVGK